MSISQLLAILGGLALCQVIAMALPYWMGWRSGQAAATALLQDEILRLRAELSSAHASISEIERGVSYA